MAPIIATIKGRRRITRLVQVKRGKSHLKKVETKVKKFMKHHPLNTRYINLGNTSVANILQSAPYVTTLNVIAEGTDEINRVGDRGYMSWLKLTIQPYITANNPTTSSATFVRIMIVREKTCLGSALSLSQFLQGAGTPVTNAQRNYITRDHDRYQVLYDSGAQYLCPTIAATAAPVYNGQNLSGPNLKSFTINRKLGFLTDYSRGNAGTVADIDTNSLSLIVITDNTIANNVAFNYSYVLAADF